MFLGFSCLMRVTFLGEFAFFVYLIANCLRTIHIFNCHRLFLIWVYESSYANVY